MITKKDQNGDVTMQNFFILHSAFIILHLLP